MTTDPVADTLIRIKNGYLASKPEIKIPCSRMRKSILAVLKDYGFVEDYKKNQDKPHSGFNVYLFNRKERSFCDLKQVSKPGSRVYVKAKNIPRVRNGFGICLLSTPEGVMSGEKARKKNLGGELLAEVW